MQISVLKGGSMIGSRICLLDVLQKSRHDASGTHGSAPGYQSARHNHEHHFGD